MRNKVLIILAALILSGCAVRHGDFTAVSNHVVRLSEFEIEKADRINNIEGSDVTHIIIIFPIGGNPTFEAAIDEALEKGDGDLMTDATITSWGWYIPYIYGQVGWSVKGDVVKTRRN